MVQVRHFGFMAPNAKVPLSKIRELICALYEIVAELLPAKKAKRKKPEELDYDDALAGLRAELGESEPPLTDQATAEPQELATSEARPAPDPGFQVSPEVARWMSATENHIRRVWITPPEFLNRNLRTGLDHTRREVGDLHAELALAEQVEQSNRANLDRLESRVEELQRRLDMRLAG